MNIASRNINLTVSDISTFLFCPRKLYLKKIMNLKEPLNINLVLGQVHHEVIENFYQTEKSIVSSITPADSPKDIILKYKSEFYALLVQSIAKRRTLIRKTASSSLEVFQQAWGWLSRKAERRSSIVIDLIDKNKVYGTDLWQTLQPKVSTEIPVFSSNLKVNGRIDQIEHSGEHWNDPESSAIPIEVKSANAPAQGAWESHEAQLVTYLMILNEKKPEINAGYIEYNDKRTKVDLDSEKKKKILLIMENIRNMLNSNSAPPRSENKNKCAKCGLMKECHSLIEV